MHLCLYLAFAVRVGPVGAGVAQQIASAGAAQKMLGGVSCLTLSTLSQFLHISPNSTQKSLRNSFVAGSHHGEHCEADKASNPS